MKKVGKIRKGSCITVIGKTWLHRSAGNTYNSFKVFVNNVFIYSEEGTYGSDYENRAVTSMCKRGLIPNECIRWSNFDERYKNLFICTEVKREKDLDKNNFEMLTKKASQKR